MVSRISQRAVYLVTAVIVASMVGGFALASMTLNAGVNHSYQGSQTTLVGAVPGLTWVATDVNVVPTNGWGSTFTACAPIANICDVTTSGYTVCAGGFTGALTCAPSDYIEQVNLTVSTSVAFPTLPVTLTVYVTGMPVGATTPSTFVGVTVYFTEGSTTPTPPAASESILLDYDIGVAATGPGAVSVVSVLATTSP